MPERSDALKKAQQKYMERFSVARVRMEHDRYERVQAHAAAQGESVSGFINRAIDETMERDGLERPTVAAGGAEDIPHPEKQKAAQRAHRGPQSGARGKRS